MRLRLVMFGGAATSLALAAASLVVASPATAAPPDSRSRAVAKLKAASDRTPTVATDRSGVVRNLRTAPGHPVDRPAGVRKGATAELTARGVVRTYAAAFGLKDDAALRTESTTRTPSGHDVVRFQQTVGGLPVLGGDLVTTVRPDGGTLSVNSTVSTAPVLATAPRITAQSAAATARAKTAEAEKLPASVRLTVATPQLVMFDPAVFGVVARPGLHPVWQTKVTGDSARGPVGADVLVDARTGTVTLYANAIHTALNRQVCDHNAVALTSEQGLQTLCPANAPAVDSNVPGGKVKAIEGAVAADASTDVVKAYDYSGRTYNFYSELFGRDSVDGAGKQLRSSVRVCPPGSTSGSACYQNAYWDGDQMVYGPGFASADDVVAHELTHGVVEHTANLHYWYQSGAINESMADVFGEMVDQFDTADGGDPNWLIGEDLPIGAIRSMSNPEIYSDPKTMTSANYNLEEQTSARFDNGGVHSNSGVGNYAAYLIATGLSGGTAGTVTGPGLSKAAHIYYETLNSLSSGADYADLAGTLQSSCNNLVNSLAVLNAKPLTVGDPTTVTVTAADCDVVTSAITATQMTTHPGPDTAATPDAPSCPDGTGVVTPLFSDDMENAAAGKWSYTAADPKRDPWDAYTNYFNTTTFGASYAKSGQTSLIGITPDQGSNTAAGNTGRIQTSAAIDIPTGKQTFLWFAHADDLVDGRNDGARVSAAYTDAAGVARIVDVGVPDPSTAPSVNGYTGTLASDSRPAFVGDSHGYVSTRFDLTRFAGKSVKPTFDIIGNATAPTNWWLDDVKVYTCTGLAPSKPKALTTTPTSASAVTLSWSAPEWAGDSAVKEYVVEGGPNGPTTVSADVRSLPVTGLSSTKAYQFTVKAVATDATAGLTTSASVVPTTSTLGNSPSAATYGGTVNVYGTATQAGTSTRLAGTTVTVQGRYAGSSTWFTAGTVKTTSTGAWKVTHKPYRNLQYRVLVPAVPGRWAGAGSRVGSSSVAPKVGAAFRAGTIRLRQTASVSTTVAPGRKYTVELQRRDGGKWVVVQRKATNSKGAVTLTVRPTKRGKYTYRVVTRADSYNRAGTSSSRTLTVR